MKVTKLARSISTVHIFYVYFLLLAAVLVAEASPANKRYTEHPANNVVIKAEIGQTVNISCYFDNEGQVTSKRRRSHAFKRSSSGHNRHIFKSVDYSSHNYGSDGGDADEQINPNSYEVDWFFLDNQGRMNIISYGAETTSRHKYKTFFRRNSDQEPPQSGLDTGNGPYSSSALYSQSIRGNGNEFKLNQRSSPNQSTYYLSALIESENDEGVYQCINPFKPNHVIQNTTVLIARNDSNRLQMLSLHQSLTLVLTIISFIAVRT